MSKVHITLSTRICVKRGLSLSKKVGRLRFNKILLKVKNAFYFMLKALFVLNIFKFLSMLCPYGLIRRLRLISKFSTLQTGKQIMTKYLLSNISRSKGTNHTMKLGYLRQYKMTNIFLEKSYKKDDGEASPKPFYKRSKLSISLDQQLEMLHSLFLLCT